jgi:hypothetical protein
VLCSVCQTSIEEEIAPRCSYCEATICFECVDERYEVDWEETICVRCAESYRDYLFADHLQRKCFKCEAKIYFLHALKSADFPEDQFLKVWKSPHVELLCCECFEKGEKWFEVFARSS